MTVAQMTDYRQKIKAAGGRVKVAKNRLAKLALEDFRPPGSPNSSRGRRASPTRRIDRGSKVAVTYAKTNDKLVILGGAMGTTVLDAKGVKALAERLAG